MVISSSRNRALNLANMGFDRMTSTDFVMSHELSLGAARISDGVHVNECTYNLQASRIT